MDGREYPVVGKVEISTTEYRELIEKSIVAERDADNYRSKYWSEQSEKNKVSESLDLCKNKLNDLVQFLTDENLMDKYKLWKISKQQEEED